MIEIHVTIQIDRKVKYSCKAHRAFNPELDGPGAIKRRCPDCEKMLELYKAKVALERAAHLFEDIANSILKEEKAKRNKAPAA